MTSATSKSKLPGIILRFAEAFLILGVIISFMQPRLSRSFALENFNTKGAIQVAIPEFGWYIDNSISTESSVFLETSPIDIPKGVYKIIVHYQTSGDGTTITPDADSPTYRLIAGRQNLKLESILSSSEYEFHITEDEKNFHLDFNYDGNGFAWISGVELIQTWALERVHAFYVVLIIIFAELLYFLSRKKIWTTLLCSDMHTCSLLTACIVGFPVLLSSLPCFTYYVINGFDLNFHMLRIEGISQAIKSCQLPARIPTNWLKGYGYPVSVFYGDLLLYIPGMLRAIGMTLQDAYKIFVVLINLLTGFIMYFSAKEMTNSRLMAITASYLYLLLPYRLSCLYVRAGVGEYCAMAFFPLIVCGLYQIYTLETTSYKWKKTWILPVIGFTGVIQSHLLSTVFVGLFTTLCCLLLFKKTFQKERFISLVKVVAATLLANLIYLVPLLDFMQQDFKVGETASNARIQTQGAYISQIFSLLPTGSKFSLSITDNLKYADEMVFSLGIVAWLGFFIFFLFAFLTKRNSVLHTIEHDFENKNEKNAVHLFLGMGLFTLLISTINFPWDDITVKMGIFKSIFTSIEFPWRYLSLSSVFLILGCMLALNNRGFKQEANKLFQTGISVPFFLCIMAMLITVVSGGHFTSKIVSDNNSLYIAANCDLDDVSLQGSEYIPVGVEERELLYLQDAESTNASLNTYYNSPDGYYVSVSSSSADAKIIIPRIYYEGYAAKLYASNTWTTCYSDEIGRVCFDLPEGYCGEILIRFREPWYWRVSEVISLITLLGIIFLLLRCRFTRTNLN